MQVYEPNYRYVPDRPWHISEEQRNWRNLLAAYEVPVTEHGIAIPTFLRIQADPIILFEVPFEERKDLRAINDVTPWVAGLYYAIEEARQNDNGILSNPAAGNHPFCNLPEDGVYKGKGGGMIGRRYD